MLGGFSVGFSAVGYSRDTRRDSRHSVRETPGVILCEILCGTLWGWALQGWQDSLKKSLRFGAPGMLGKIVCGILCGILAGCGVKSCQSLVFNRILLKRSDTSVTPETNEYVCNSLADLIYRRALGALVPSKVGSVHLLPLKHFQYEFHHS